MIYSGGDRRNASTACCRVRSGKTGRDALKKLRLKVLPGAEEEDAEVVGVNAELAADLAAVALLNKDGLQKGAVARRHAREDFADLRLELAGENLIEDGRAAGGKGRFFRFIEQAVAGGSAVVLQQHVVADGVDKGAEALGIAKRPVAAEGDEDAGKGLLTDVFDGVGRLETRTELEIEQGGEIADEMFLDAGVSRAKGLNITGIERVEFQRELRSLKIPKCSIAGSRGV